MLNHVAGLEEISKLDGYQHADPDDRRLAPRGGRPFLRRRDGALNRIGDDRARPSMIRVRFMLPTVSSTPMPSSSRLAGPAHISLRPGVAEVCPTRSGSSSRRCSRTSNMAFSLCRMLTQGAVEAVHRHGPEALQDTYLEKLVTGELGRHHEPHRT